MRILTEPTAVFSAQSESAENFLPMTAAINSTQVRYVLLGIWLEPYSSENIKIRPAYQYSNDGVTWDSPTGVDLGGAPYTQTAGWTYTDTVRDLEPTGSTPKFFIRFGVLVLNLDVTPDDTKSQGGTIRLSVQVRPMPSGTLTYDYTKVNSQGDATETFIPVGGPITATSITALRAAFEMIGTAGDNLQIGAAFQVSYDGITWTGPSGGAGTFEVIGSQVRATNGTKYTSEAGTPGWDLVGQSYKHPFMRFGVRAKNVNGDTTVKAALVRLRVDWR